MSFMLTALRRSVWLVLIGAVGGAGVAWWRDRNAPPDPTSPPEWPPLTVAPAPSGSGIVPDSDAPATSQPDTSKPDTGESTVDTPATSAAAGSTMSTLAAVPVEPPEAEPAAATPSPDEPAQTMSEATVDLASGWVDAADDGSCPLSHPIKANDNSGIFHVPEGRFYKRTKAERCYATVDEALADGYRQAKA